MIAVAALVVAWLSVCSHTPKAPRTSVMAPRIGKSKCQEIYEAGMPVQMDELMSQRMVSETCCGEHAQ